ncbi:MAG: IPT/TIG domain-containing protein [Candidatus Symbiothrix sp.]|nr:IPT/TIG domain-containing protein [Candidatus Symbiothrix sp.]
MKKFIFLSLLLIMLGAASAKAQVVISERGLSENPHAAAILDLQSNAKGLLLPHVALKNLETLQVGNSEAEEDLTAIGMIVYNISPNFCEGVYFWNGSQWRKAGKDYQVRANALNNLVITAPAADEIVGGDAVTFKATPDNAKFYSWYLNDTLLATTPSSIFTTTAIREGTNHKMKVVLDDCLSLSSAEITFNAVNISPASMPATGGDDRWIRIYNGNDDFPFPYAATSEYVQDGLVAHYDGINNTGEGDKYHSLTTATWTNLKGTAILPHAEMCADTFCISQGISPNLSWEVNSAHFGTANFTSWFRIYKPNYVPPQYTLELVYKTDEAHTSNERIQVSNFDVGGFGIKTGSAIGAGNVALQQHLGGSFRFSPIIPYEVGKLLTLSGQLINNAQDGCKLAIYVDGVGNIQQISDTVATAKPPTNATGWAIGANPGGTRADGTFLINANIYSVRLYDKTLSLDQIKHNVGLDHKRYLAPPVVTIDDIPCTNVTVLSPRCLTCQVPAGTPGEVEVKVFPSDSDTPILTYDDGEFTYTQ